MKRYWIEYTPIRTFSPMTYWVHLPTDGKTLQQATCFEPALPDVIAGRGYPNFFVEFDGFTFRFASLTEIDACIAVLGRKLLLTTRQLVAQRPTGPNGHWFSRLPKDVKPWRYRERAVAYLHQARQAFEHMCSKESNST